MNTLSSLLNWIGNQFNIVHESFTITRTSGLTVNSSLSSFVRYGKVVNALIVVTASSTEISAGGNIFVGTLTTQKLWPVENNARLVAYIGQRPIVCTINTSGGINVRNTSSTALTLAGDLYLAGTYLIN